MNRKTALKAHFQVLPSTLRSEWPLLFAFASGIKRGLLRFAFRVTGKSLEAHPDYHHSKIYPSQETLERLKDEIAALPEKPLISILVPTFNTKPHQIRDLVESILGQVYTHWELCLVDDRSSDERLLDYLKTLPQLDKRFKVHLSTERLRIARASNLALESASGQYCALVDHDDVLLPHALAEVALFLAHNPGAQMIYSDHAMIDDKGRFLKLESKPEWSPEFFLSTCYTTHLRVFTRSILLNVKGFRPECEAAQDIDLICRVSEKTQKIYHLAKCLYLWRISSTSVTSGVGSQPHIIRNSLEAYNSHLSRIQSPFRNFLPPQFKKSKVGAFRLDFSMVKGPVDIVQYFPRGIFDEAIRIDNLIAESQISASQQYIFIPKENYISKKLDSLYAQPEITLIPYDKENEIGACLQKLQNPYVIFLVGSQVPMSRHWWKEFVGYLALSDEIGAVSTRLRFVNNFFASSSMPSRKWLASESIYSEEQGPEKMPIDGYFVRDVDSLNPFVFALRTSTLRAYPLNFGLNFGSKATEGSQSLAKILQSQKQRIVLNPWPKIEVLGDSLAPFTSSLT